MTAAQGSSPAWWDEAGCRACRTPPNAVHAADCWLEAAMHYAYERGLDDTRCLSCGRPPHEHWGNLNPLGCPPQRADFPASEQ